METIYKKQAEADDETSKQIKCMFGSIIGAFVGDAAGAKVEFMEKVTQDDV